MMRVMVAWQWRSAVIVLLAVAVNASPSAAQDWECDPPSLAVEPAHGEAGAELTITGGGFASECRDWIICGDWGCRVVPPEPEATVELAFEQDGRLQVIAIAHPTGSDPDPPAEGYAFTVRAAVPVDARPGSAAVTAVPGADSWWEVVPVAFEVVAAAALPTPVPEPAAPAAGPTAEPVAPAAGPTAEPVAPAAPGPPATAAGTPSASRDLPATGPGWLAPLLAGCVVLLAGGTVLVARRARPR